MVQDHAGEALDIARSYTVQHRIVMQDGAVKHVQQQGQLIIGDGRGGRWIAGTIQDISQQRRDQEKISYLANYDSLTGLANRRLLGEHLDMALARAKEDGRPVGLLYMDLDRFKRINDTLGHSAGDQLLRHVADLLRTHTHALDVVARPEQLKAPDHVSRMGGDEFIVLLAEIESAEDAGRVGERILAALANTIDIEGHQVSAAGSIGVAIFPDDGCDAETLIRHADTAMYHAKENGRNNVQFFSHSMNDAAERDLMIDTKLRVALAEGLVEVHYQPKLDLANEKIYGMEALARWHDPEVGGIFPKEFIALAEESGLIVPLGNYILTTACRQAQQWTVLHGLRLKVSVNVSPVQFIREDFLTVVTEALKSTGLDPHQLELEITETLVLEDDEATALMMRDLRAMGVSISLDDFGTGYSALSYLTRFPLDALKLDRCFVRDIDTDPAAAGVASAVVSMAHSLGFDVIAEGVDSEEQKAILRDWGCDAIQGFLISAALKPEDFLTFALDWEGAEEKPTSSPA